MRFLESVRLFKDRVARWRLRYIPRLMWHGQQVDIRITFTENRLHAAGHDEAIGQLKNGQLPEIAKMLHELGIEFDTGLGERGRDWEWDFSLRGPVSVEFIGPCKTVERRLETQGPSE